MRFYTIERNGQYLPAVSNDGGKKAYLFVDLGIDFQDIAGFIRKNAFENLQTLREALKGVDEGEAFTLEGEKVCAPIMHPDQDIVCLGVNYKDHAAEAASFDKAAFGGGPAYTVYFSKRVECASGTGDVIPSHADICDSLDYEVELGVVLGADAKAAKVENAEALIFGYTIINDVTARNLQTRHKQWYLGKSLDGFTPMGPCIVTTDELRNPFDLDISCKVNDELRQHSNTGLLIQSVPAAIAELSAGMTLKAGTVIASGTPSGVGMGLVPPRFLNVGDVVTCSIEGIGEIVNTVVE